MMKAKSRPASPTVGNHFQGSSILNRKKKARHHLEIDGKAAELMTASTGKRRLVCVSSSLAMPSLELVGGKGVKAAGHTKELTDDACESLRLAFSTIDGPSVDLKVCVQATHPSILDTIFSPIHMPMGILGEASSNCNHRGEHHQHLDEKMEMVENRQDDNNNACEEENDQATLASCLTLDVHRDASVTKLPIDATMTMQDTMANTRSLLDDELIGSQTTFDVTESSMVWPLLDENAAISHRHDTESFEEGLLNSDGACLFFAMQQTMSLECNDNIGNESRVPDEIDDFDPYLFIKSLPDLVEVVAPYRPILLTRQTRRWPPITLVLDLDETLVHSTLEHCDDADFTFPVHFNLKEHTVYVRCRPYLQVFMERVAQMFEVIVFTASQSIYAEQLLNMLDPKQKLIHHRVYRESCVFVEGNYMKDLTVLGRDLAKIAIIDNSPQAFGFQVDNGIPIESWFDDRSDCALLSLLPFLETLVGVDDVRPIIAKKFNLRQKISTITVEHPSLEHRGDLFSGHL